MLQTPPRVITLGEHYFPSADDFPPQSEPSVEQVNAASVRPKAAHFNVDQRMALR